MSKSIRLQKYLAHCGIASRRKAESLIAAGRVKVNGKVVTDMGIKIDPSRHTILFDDTPVQKEPEKRYYLLNKPAGYVTTVDDPQGRPVVTSLVKDSPVRLYPVGRLDLDTEGALILTNDGNFAQQVQHPSYEITKTYEARVSGVPARQNILRLEKGIEIEGKTTAPAKVTVLKKESQTSLIQITIHEGRKRQVKKMFGAIGHPVIHLKRTAYGALPLGKLGRGSYRLLTPKDLKKIFQNIPLQTKK